MPLTIHAHSKTNNARSLSPAKPTIVYDTYWRFAVSRQDIFFKKLEGSPPPWTEDPILGRYKFTNAYRASDRVSQYLIRNVIYQGDQSTIETMFRVLLFKFFNKISTWELLKAKLGEISYSSFSFERYDQVLTAAQEKGDTIYSAAYIMPSGVSSFGHHKKHRNHLMLIDLMMREEVPIRLVHASTMRKAFEILNSYPTIGTFLAYQYITDINYSELTHFSESDFVVPGPGALDGIRKCFSDLGGLNEIDIIRVVAERQEKEFEQRGLKFRSLWGRPLQYIDCQNLFCEISKYSRIKHPEIKGTNGRVRIKQGYRSQGSPIEYMYPPKWNINQFIPNIRRPDVYDV